MSKIYQLSNHSRNHNFILLSKTDKKEASRGIQFERSNLPELMFLSQDKHVSNIIENYKTPNKITQSSSKFVNSSRLNIMPDKRKNPTYNFSNNNTEENQYNNQKNRESRSGIDFKSISQINKTCLDNNRNRLLKTEKDILRKTIKFNKNRIDHLVESISMNKFLGENSNEEELKRKITSSFEELIIDEIISLRMSNFIFNFQKCEKLSKEFKSKLNEIKIEDKNLDSKINEFMSRLDLTYLVLNRPNIYPNPDENKTQKEVKRRFRFFCCY